MIFFHVIHHFSLVFDGELIANDFKYHRDILDTMVDVDIKDKEEFIKELMKLFIIVFYVILHSFLPRNQLIIILCTHGHVGHHGGSRGQGGVHQVVYYFCHIIHHFKYSGLCWTPGWTSTSRTMRSLPGTCWTP